MIERLSNWQVRNMPVCNDTETLLLNLCGGLACFPALFIAITIWERHHSFRLAILFGFVIWFILFLLFGTVALEGYVQYRKRKLG